MDEPWLRLFLVAGSAVMIVAGALATRRWQRPSHAAISLTGLDLPSGIVIFTSTECSSCREALEVVRGTGAPVREVTWELEGRTLEQAGVTSVPLTVVLDSNGVAIDQMIGVPRRRRLGRAIAEWRERERRSSG